MSKEFRSKPQLKVGTEFTSRHFSAMAKVVAIREDENKCDVELTPSNGFAWVERNWNLDHVKGAFENGDYVEISSGEAQKRLNDKNYHVI